jgi:hypothetical protein
LYLRAPLVFENYKHLYGYPALFSELTLVTIS